MLKAYEGRLVREFDAVLAVSHEDKADLLALNNAGLGINVTGYVEDPTPYQQSAAVMVVPVRAGGGMGVKILNALAEGIPIVSTTLGHEGIEVTPGQHILVGDTPEVFAAQVLRVLNTPELGRQLAASGRGLVEQQYDYRQVCLSIETVY